MLYQEWYPEEENKPLRFNLSPRRDMSTTEIHEPGHEPEAGPQRAKKRKWWPWLLGVGLVLLLLVAMCSGGGGDDSPTTAEPPKASQSGKKASSSPKKPTVTPEMPGIGDTVKDGDIQFKVKSFKCGIKEISNDFDKN